ncbi:DUF6665 family protein [Anaeromyxobacter oryzisoli]|uniref:DUF6665 family protein n=1 Tax=Anaeromyxobacter oryzisoli TaxID=2925408 RepID=UPI001F58B7EC|nr:DUF6665 family protein [Anaeromyxobacter sp. SG63]
MADPVSPVSPIEAEILGEQTSALARATRLLEDALQRLEQATRAAAAASRSAALRTEALAEARELLWNVLVQREAMGILHHEILYDALRVPAEVRVHPRPRAVAR